MCVEIHGYSNRIHSRNEAIHVYELYTIDHCYMIK